MSGRVPAAGDIMDLETEAKERAVASIKDGIGVAVEGIAIIIAIKKRRVLRSEKVGKESRLIVDQVDYRRIIRSRIQDDRGRTP